MPIVALVLLLCLVASLARNRQLRQRILVLEAESVRALEDDGLMAQIETAAAAGSDLAARLLTGNGPVRLQIAEGKTGKTDQDMLEGFESDWAACKEPTERFDVFVRWHKKGCVMPLQRREKLLRSASDTTTRNAYRKYFDEQDAGLNRPRTLATATQ